MEHAAALIAFILFWISGISSGMIVEKGRPKRTQNMMVPVTVTLWFLGLFIYILGQI